MSMVEGISCPSEGCFYKLGLLLVGVLVVASLLVRVYLGPNIDPK